MNAMTFHDVGRLAEIAPSYVALRAKFPEAPARTVHAYLRSHGDDTFEEFCCPGHEWTYTGAAYGGDDESYYGEGRCYCALCGKDGDS